MKNSKLTFKDWLEACAREAMSSEWCIDPAMPEWPTWHEEGLTPSEAINRLFLELNERGGAMKIRRPNPESRKKSEMLKLMVATSLVMEQAEKMSNAELAEWICREYGDERIDTLKSAIAGEIAHRLYPQAEEEAENE